MKSNFVSIYSATKILAILAISATINMASCKKFVDVEIPPNQLTPAQGFSDSLTALSSILSVYGYYYTTGVNNLVLNTNRIGAMSADDAYYFNTTLYDNFRNNTLAVGNEADIVFNDPYFILGIVNTNLEGLEKATTVSETFKRQLTGEMKFWRGYLYYFLVNYFGGVPLALNSDGLNNARLAKSTPEQVWEQIETDLKEAKLLLTDNYPSGERARVNKKAATAMLARVYLYRGKYPDAEREASEVIAAASTYKLETDLSKVFVKTSNEVIWQIANVNGVTRMGINFIPASTTPAFILTDTLTRTFAANDKRKAEWTKAIVDGSITYYYPFKYRLRSGTTGNEYAVMLRLAEQYLIRSEARLKNNDKPGAIADVDQIRYRAGLPLIADIDPGISDAALQDTIDHERWTELFTESSDRWFNLKRRGKAIEVLKKTKPLWQDFQLLYPFPQNDINSNVNLIQNPGYER